MTRVPYGRIFDGERELAPDDADENWYGRELERHARRANAALDERDRFGRIFVELAHVAKLLELLELLKPEPLARIGAVYELPGRVNIPNLLDSLRAAVVAVGGDTKLARHVIALVNEAERGEPSGLELFPGAAELVRATSSRECTCVDWDHTGKVPPASGCPVHTTSSALAEVLELSRRRR